MIAFFRDRGPWLAAVVVIMLAISIAQAGISYTMTLGALSGLLPRDRTTMTTVLVLVRFGLVALMAALWVAKRKSALFRLIVIVNALSRSLCSSIQAPSPRFCSTARQRRSMPCWSMSC